MFVRCHPLARDVLVSSSYDKTVKLWDLDQQTEMLELKDHSDAVRYLNLDVGLVCDFHCLELEFISLPQKISCEIKTTR